MSPLVSPVCLRGQTDPLNPMLAAYTYDALSRRTSITFGNGAATSFAYEVDDDLDAVSFDFPGGLTTDLTLGYAYNNVGQLTREVINAGDPAANFQWVTPANATTGWSTPALVNFTQSAAGNMGADDVNAFAYNVLNQMARAAMSLFTLRIPSDLDRQHILHQGINSYTN